MGIASSFVAPETTCIDAQHPSGAPDEGAEFLTGTSLPPTQAGTWSYAVERPCRSSPSDGRTCIPGGFGVLGDYAARWFATELVQYEPVPLRPVAISPFHLDTDEVTVGRARALVLSGALPESALQWPSSMTDSSYCTWLGADIASNDALPLNCVAATTAGQVCSLLGGTLPSEAQWEYAARGRGQGRRYPWGNDDPTCCALSAGRAFGGSSPPECPGSGPEPVGSHLPTPSCGGLGDITRDGVRDMGGSVAEILLDALEPYTAPCWEGACSSTRSARFRARWPLRAVATGATASSWLCWSIAFSAATALTSVSDAPIRTQPVMRRLLSDGGAAGLAVATATTACQRDPARATSRRSSSRRTLPSRSWARSCSSKSSTARATFSRRNRDGSSTRLRASAWPISFGVVPAAPGVDARLRLRLYRLDQTGDDGLPSGSALLDRTASLPPPHGLTRVGVTLAMACFGVPANPAAATACDPASGLVAPELALTPLVALGSLPAPGSWPPSTSVPCAGDVPPGMVCIPGGAFLLGTLAFVPQSADVDPVRAPRRALAVRHRRTGGHGGPNSMARSRRFGARPHRAGRDAGLSRDDVHVRRRGRLDRRCRTGQLLAWITADSACRALGKRLPTEAEWEYAARNRDEETPYPWGSDPNVCTYAVVASGPISEGAIECESTGAAAAPGLVAGGNPLDRTALGVLNMSGNVSEWVADVFAPYSAPCWSGPLPLVNPQCQAPAGPHSNRGGAWDLNPSLCAGDRAQRGGRRRRRRER